MWCACADEETPEGEEEAEEEMSCVERMKTHSKILGEIGQAIEKAGYWYNFKDSYDEHDGFTIRLTVLKKRRKKK